MQFPAGAPRDGWQLPGMGDTQANTGIGRFRDKRRLWGEHLWGLIQAKKDRYCYCILKSHLKH